MKVLDPQSALLTNVEVHQFMKANAPRKPDKKVGAYPSVNLKDHARIRKDFETYVKDVTPYVGDTPPVEEWMKDLVTQLKPCDLAQTEVMNLINLGIGLRNSSNSDELDGSVDGDDAQQRLAGSLPGNDDVLFKIVVEESEERFPGEEGENAINEIIRIIGDALRRAPTTNDKNGHHE